MQHRTQYEDKELIAAIRKALSSGANKDNVGDRLKPNNLLSFFNNLPRPERDRLNHEAMKK